MKWIIAVIACAGNRTKQHQERLLLNSPDLNSHISSQSVASPIPSPKTFPSSQSYLFISSPSSIHLSNAQNGRIRCRRNNRSLRSLLQTPRPRQARNTTIPTQRKPKKHYPTMYVALPKPSKNSIYNLPTPLIAITFPLPIFILKSLAKLPQKSWSHSKN